MAQLPETLAAVEAKSVIAWTLGVAELEDVHVHVSTGGEEIEGSPFDCEEHPSIPGVYLLELTFTDVATYALEWHGDEHEYMDTQNLIVIEELTSTPTVNVRVMDPGLRQPLAAVRVVFVHLDKDSGGYVVDTDTTTDDEGYASSALGKGEYAAVLSKDGYVFSNNNFFFTIDPLDLIKPLLINAPFLEVPAAPYVPPTELVTMSVKLIGPSGQPIRYRDISISSRQPSTYSEGDNFIVGEDAVIIKTDANGIATTELVPGASIEIAVEGTRLNRRFVVPSEDFNLSSYVTGAENDYFQVVSLPYAEAETP